MTRQEASQVARGRADGADRPRDVCLGDEHLAHRKRLLVAVDLDAPLLAGGDRSEARVRDDDAGKHHVRLR